MYNMVKEAYPTCSGDHAVWNEVQTESHGMEHVSKQLYDLEGQHVLSHVVSDLEYGCLPHRSGRQLGRQGAQGWREGGKEISHNAINL